MFYVGVYELHKLDPTYGYKILKKNPKLGLERERERIDLGGVRQVGSSELDKMHPMKFSKDGLKYYIKTK